MSVETLVLGSPHLELPLAQLALSLVAPEDSTVSVLPEDNVPRGVFRGIPYTMPIDAWWGSDGKKASEQVVKIEYSRLQQDVDAQLRQVCPDVNSITRSFDRALLALLREMTYSLDASGAPHRLLLLVNERPFTPWLPGFERMQREISQLAPYIPGLPEKGDPWRIIFKYESDDFAYEPIVNDENRAYWAGALH